MLVFHKTLCIITACGFPYKNYPVETVGLQSHGFSRWNPKQTENNKSDADPS